jgi:hypothetical protein
MGSGIWKSGESGKQLVISSEQVWNGYEEVSSGKTRTHINGLLRDWITWQNNPERYPFDTFKRVLRKLSPPDIGPIEPGDPTRLPGDAREIPTILHKYGQVPILYAAAGVRRIIALAYLIVWAWEEHRIQSELIKKRPQRRMVIMVDEIEAHLHPKWQRNIVPALANLGDELSSELKVQFIITTHSPLIMVSLEALFDENTDRLFHLQLKKSTKQDSSEINLSEIPFIKHGRIDNWLTSDIFELKQARSQEAEQVIEEAKLLQLKNKPDLEQIRSISQQLINLLAYDDEFWPRWKYFAERNGVEL